MSLSPKVQCVTIEYTFNLTEVVQYGEVRDDNKRSVCTFTNTLLRYMQ